MDWTAQVDSYCERLGPGFWAEPWNAVTNISFLLGAAVAFVLALRRGSHDWPVITMVVIAVCVGIGSFLFHTFATVWARLADVLFIQIFIVFYFVFAMRRFAELPWWGAALATIAFLVVSVVGGGALRDWLGNALNGSEGYVPPLLALIMVGAALTLWNRTGAGISLMLAGVLFAVSLTFRTIDMDVCSVFPLGTHFIWHTLNGVLLGLLIIAMSLYGVSRRRVAKA